MVLLDVREDLRQGREPFQRIMAAAAALPAGEDMELIAPFEPVPLYVVLENRGFSHVSRQTDEGFWRVVFRREYAE